MSAFGPAALMTYGAVFLASTVPVWGRWVWSGVLALVDGIGYVVARVRSR